LARYVKAGNDFRRPEASELFVFGRLVSIPNIVDGTIAASFRPPLFIIKYLVVLRFG
jgi:hypothetical protein